MEETGPDRILPTDKLCTWLADGAVRIRMTKDWPANRETMSVPTLVKKQCLSGGTQTACAVKRNGRWVQWSYNDYYRDCCIAGRALIKLGLEPFHGVCILGFNSPEWFFSDIGAIMAGGVAVGLYPTNSAETNKFIMADCEANILVVEDDKALGKLYEMRNELPNLKKIVQYIGEPVDKPDVISWKEFMEIGKNESDEMLNSRQANMAINQCCTLVYTSGTTGNPKGVMISHDNLYWTALGAADLIQMRESREVIISYLPLSHIAGNMLDIWAPIVSKATVYFADRMALKGTLLDTLKECRPTIFFGVPRVWEKIMEGMLDKGKAVKGLKRKIADSCKKAGLDHHLNGKDGVMYNVGKKVIYKKVKEALGLDRCVSFFSGAAPISIDVLKYFLSLDIVILELYGMSEVTGPQSMSYYGSVKVGSVGKIFPGAKNRLANQDDKGEGEVCMWGRHVMMGYLNREDKTTEDMDEEGWMHSGDLGSMDDDGFLHITGRIKELIITAGGENIAPVPIEESIKKELPCISNAILIGDKRKFLTVFLTFKVVMDTATEAPTRKLTASAIEWCRSVGSNASTVDEILKGPDAKVMEAIQAGIDKSNKGSVSNAARVQRWTILPTDVSIPGGELGPTLKLKRFYFNKKYDDTIERLYV